MVRVENIRIAEHLTDIRCDACGTFQQDVNANTQLQYGNNPDGSPGNSTIVVPCTGQDCGSVSYYPTQGGDSVSCQLAEAKTA